jgi:DnaJ-class molecular chaperone
MADDHYQILGVSRTATSDDIQKAYREMARKYHPDLHPDDDAAKEQFKKVQTAFDVLNDPSKREMYDRYGSSFEGVGAGGGGWSPQGQAGGFQSGGEVDLESLFGGGGFADLFGGGKRRTRRNPRTPGEDITANIRIPFQLAIDGGKTEVRFERDNKHETLSITIPQGIPDGSRMRLRGQGRPGRGGGAAGDLLLEVNVEQHAVYHREGDTLAVSLPISLSEALEGAKVDLPTPWGTISLRIPEGTSSGKKLRAGGMGVRHANGSKGDLIAEVQIVLPVSDDEAASKALLDSAKIVEASVQEDPRAAIKW